MAKATASTGDGTLGATVQAAPYVPPTYETGAVKQDPVTKAVAVRTNIPDPDSNHDWGVMTVDRGGYYADYETVASWTDLS